MQPKEVVNLNKFWNEWLRCQSFRYQRDQVYRFGRFESCSNRWDDLWKAARAKVSTDTKYAKEIMDTTYYRRTHKKSSTMGVIWDAKNPPSWE
ncbi:hypothetical protein ACA910_018494 [Epithemia clementina (nom. ined.)]